MIVGITGHQVIGDAAAVDWVRRELENQLRGLDVTLGLSSLAVGADQLFVEVLSTLHIPFEAVLPSALYEDTFTDQSALSMYRSQLSVATRVHCLPYSQPSEEAFYAAGKWIVEHCDLLIAVWNGLPARGLGGTADVVRFAIDKHRAWVRIDPRKQQHTVSQIK